MLIGRRRGRIHGAMRRWTTLRVRIMIRAIFFLFKSYSYSHP